MDNYRSFATKSTQEVLKELQTNDQQGLSFLQVKERLKIFGLNKISLKKINAWEIFFRQLKTPFFYLLLIASFIAFIIGEKINALMIIFFVIINTFFSFYQEFKAERAMELLKKYLSKNVIVRRDGREQIIEETLIVPGDIIILKAGDIVPADLRLIKTNNFFVDEEILTGESAPVFKTDKTMVRMPNDIFEAENIVFMGTSVVSGQAEGVVIFTGKNTFFGKTTYFVPDQKKESAYEQRIISFSKKISQIVLFSVFLLFLFHLIFKRDKNILDFFIFFIALIVAVIPEALPAVVTFSLSRGALNLAKKKMVVKRLSAIEDLGNIDILCTDKTGTLTENKLILDKIFSQDQERMFLYFWLFREEKIKKLFDPFELAVFQRTPTHILKESQFFKKISEIPFDNVRMRTSILVKRGEERILIVKGAPDILLELSENLTEGEREEIIKQMKEEGKRGKRILGIAYKRMEKDEYFVQDESRLIFLGFFSFFDSLKKDTKKAMALAQQLGLKIKILTGDTPEVAGAVGKEIGLVKSEQEVITGSELEKLEADEFEKKCEQFSIFARLNPLLKLKIVEALEKKYRVGFLGEGINDVPCLRASHVGLVVKEGSDVSREVADIVLLKKDLRTIVEGIRQGRTIFSNINKYIKTTLSSNFGNFYSMGIISLFLPFLPMLPSQILFVNFLTDFPLITVASDSVDPSELKKPKMYELNHYISLILLLALVSSFFDFIFFFVFKNIGERLFQTLWVIMSVFTELVIIFSIRTTRVFYKASMPSLILLALCLLAFFTVIFLPFTHFGQTFFQFVPPSLPFLFLILLLALCYFFLTEIVKLLYFKYLHREGKKR